MVVQISTTFEKQENVELQLLFIPTLIALHANFCYEELIYLLTSDVHSLVHSYFAMLWCWHGHLTGSYAVGISIFS